MDAAARAGPAPEPEQIDLEDLLGLPNGALIPPAPAARGPGRPPGSRNRRTSQWVDYLLSRYASPLEVLAQMATAPVDRLKVQLGCTALEAFQEKRHCAIALAPFLHQRQPLAVNISERKVIYLTIDASPPSGRALEDSALTLEAQVIRPESETDIQSDSQDPPSD